MTALRGTRSAAANALPVARWQSRQWQLPMTIGSAEHSSRIAPHRQPPVKGTFIPNLPKT
ncbi:hypothetical protein [Brasilonema sennae]|uniref:hypothetical protein n=1 Tax=Brasilonema sennae TaxID=1397703 RepID=UPI001FEA3B2E|nr:hypothetical protein [Brasilonema sennae]